MSCSASDLQDNSMFGTVDDLVGTYEYIPSYNEDPEATEIQQGARVSFDLEAQMPVPLSGHRGMVAMELNRRHQRPILVPQTRFRTTRRLVQNEQQPESPGLLSTIMSHISGATPPMQENNGAMYERARARLVDLEIRNEQLEESVENYRRKLVDQEEGAAHYHERVQSWANSYEASQAKQHADILAECRNKIKDVHQEAETQIKASEKEKLSVQSTCRKYEDKIEALEATISKLQNAQLQSLEAMHWAPMATKDIEHELKSLMGRVRQWSTENTTLDIGQIMEAVRFDSNAEKLVSRGCISDPEQLRKALTGSKAMQKPGKAASLLLTALVTFEVMTKIVGDPFFAFVGKQTEKELGVLKAKHGAVLSHLRDWIEHCMNPLRFDVRSTVLTICVDDVAGAEVFRCQTLRLIDPPGSEDVKAKIRKAKRCADKGRQVAVSQLADAVVREFMEPLSDEQLAHAKAGLEAIMQDAAELAWKLWTRKPTISVLGWTDLLRYPTNEMSWQSGLQVREQLFEPHQLHSRILHDEPQALDGVRIVLLCSPAIFFGGNADGQDYDHMTTIKQATVWMG